MPVPSPPDTPLADSRLGRAAPLGLLVAGLLFLQWPLRDLVGAGALQANDAAQAAFAVYVSLAVAHAQHRQAHWVAHPQAAAGSRWRRLGAAAVPLPWCLWLLVTSLTPAWRSLQQLERFPETFTPGYFVIKLAVPVMALALGWQCLRSLRRAAQR